MIHGDGVVYCAFTGVQGDPTAGRMFAALDTSSFLFDANPVVCTEPTA